jgi:hypothetical protein
MPTKKQQKQIPKPTTIIHEKPTPTPSQSQTECNGSDDWMRNKIRKGAMVYYRCEAMIRSQEPNKQCRNRAQQTIIVPGNAEDVYNNAGLRLCGIHRQYSPSKTVA